jgi:hypothetical protein
MQHSQSPMIAECGSMMPTNITLMSGSVNSLVFGKMRNKNECSGYSGGFNSPLSQFAAFIGPVLTILASVWSHLLHSKLRRSNPFGPGMIRAKAMPLSHLGQRGRSICRSDGLAECE